MSEPARDSMPEHASDDEPRSTTGSGRMAGLIAFVVVSLAWLGFLLLGQVNARFWISNQHQVAYKTVRGIWSVQLGELPGGAVVQWVFAGSMLVFLAGVIAALYALLVATPDEEVDDA